MRNMEGWFDGAYRDGKIGIGGILKNGNEIIFEFSETLDGSSNNDAEYSALIKLLEFIKDTKIREPILLRGDSRLVVQQMRGEWNINGGFYVEKAFKALSLIQELKNIKIKWTARENNKEADKLSKIK